MSSISVGDIYDDLSGIFANRKSDEILEIEILTPDSGPLLRDGVCIGITKAALVRAFLVARSRLAKYIDDKNKTGATAVITRHAVNDLDIATQIILLFDCEHVTACNWRKRYISSSKLTFKDDTQFLEGFFLRETTLMTSFQCSPLHRHTKSPTLWQHRLWIITQLLDLKRQASMSGEMSHRSLHRLVLEELDVVCKSGVLHPRNYYAFSYMRQLHGLVRQISGSDGQTVLLDLAALVEPMLKWCLANPSDVSGWMYLLYLLDLESRAEADVVPKQARMVMERTIHFSIHIANWEGESLWTFVDMMITRFGLDVVPGIDTTTTELWDKYLTSGSRWKTTKDRMNKLFKNIS